MKSKDKVRFAVIGCGHIGLRHATRIAEDPEGELVALCDVLDEGEVRSRGFDSSVPYYPSVGALLESGLDFDIASVCVPNGLHFDIAAQVIRHRHHVLIEKPIVLNLSDGEELRRLAEDYGVRIYGVLQNRYSPTSQWLKSLMDRGALGQVYRVHLDCLWNRDERYYTPESWHGDIHLDGGTLYTQYSHFVDLLLWTMGRMEVLEATFVNYNHSDLIDFEDSGDVRLRAHSGTDVRLTYSTAVYGRNMGVTMTILGERGAVRLGGPFLNVLEHAVIDGEPMPELAPSSRGNDYGGYSGSAENHHQVIRGVIASLRGEPSETTSLEDGLAVVRLISDIYRYRKLS